MNFMGHLGALGQWRMQFLLWGRLGKVQRKTQRGGQGKDSYRCPSVCIGGKQDFLFFWYMVAQFQAWADNQGPIHKPMKKRFATD
jgi:hypothetical protein